MKQITNTQREVYNAAHPCFVIDVDQSRIDRLSLCQTLTTLRDTYFIEYSGTIMENRTPATLDRLFVWYYNPNFRYPDEAYQTRDLVFFLQKLGFDIDETDVYLHSPSDSLGYIGFELAPLVALPAGLTLEYMTGNISLFYSYVNLMKLFCSNNIYMQDASKHHVCDVQNQPTRKEDN